MHWELTGGKLPLHISLHIIIVYFIYRLSRCVVNVAVNDLNDNSPIFGQSTYTATVTENNANGVQIATLVVRAKSELHCYYLSALFL